MAIKVRPKFSEKIWGGDKLKKVFGYDTPSNKTGEAWVISGYKGNESMTDQGINLKELYNSKPELFGNYKTKEFPLLVKFLDANEDLSVQVHPNNKEAYKMHGKSEGKSECWYVIDAEPEADIIIGHNAKNNLELNRMFQEKDWDCFIKTQPIIKGDAFKINPGVVHAIRKGTLIYELQQSSDITYRIYDYDRLENGSPRELHLEESLKVIKYDESDIKQDPLTIISKEGIVANKIIDNTYFVLVKTNIHGKSENDFGKDKYFLLVTNIEGEVNVNGIETKIGDSIIITTKELTNVQFEGKGTLLIGYPK